MGVDSVEVAGVPGNPQLPCGLNFYQRSDIDTLYNAHCCAVVLRHFLATSMLTKC